MVASVSSYLRFPNAGVSRGALTQERKTTDWPTLAHKKINEE